MMTAQELLEANGIKLDSYKPGQHYITCPHCSHTRIKKKAKCLGVLINADGKSACWNCGHCGWSGPQKGADKANDRARDNIEATYDYIDKDGVLRFQKVRFRPGGKSRFALRRPDGRGGWIWNTAGVDTTILYRLPEVIEAIADGHEIVCVEGEKDADRLWSINVPATCNAHGAHDPSKNQKPKWMIEHSKQLAGAPIVAIPDHDPPGYAHCDATCRLSLGVAARVRRLVLREHWPDCPKGGDLSDWLDAGHTREELDALLAAAPDYARTTEQPSESEQPGEPQEPRLPYVKLTLDLEPTPWLIPDLIPGRNVTLLSGEGSIGKSLLIMQLLGSTALVDAQWLGLTPVHGSGLYLTAEEDDDEVRRRLQDVAASLGATRSDLEQAGLEVLSFAGRDAILGEPDRNAIIRPTRLFQRLRADALKLKPKLIALDAAADVFAGNENDRAQTRQFITLLRGLAIDCDSALVLIAHPSLTGIASDTGLSGNTAWHNSVRARMYFKEVTDHKNALRALQVKKQNYGPVTETMLLRWQDGVYVREGSGDVEEQAERVLERLAQEEKAEQVFLALLRRFARQGRNVSDKPSSTYAPAQFANEPEAKRDKVTKQALAEAMVRLFARDKIADVSEGSPSRLRTKIVEAEGKPSYSAAPSNDVPTPSEKPSNDIPTSSNVVCSHTPLIPPAASEGGKGALEGPPPSEGKQGKEQPSAGESDTVASVPVMITRAMKARLRARGYSDGQIANMRPKQAHDILADRHAWGGDDLRLQPYATGTANS
jgi:RecA-family ATPase